MSRTLVKVQILGDSMIGFQTISLEHKFSAQFLLKITDFNKLERMGTISQVCFLDESVEEYANPIHAFFVLHTLSRRLSLLFVWPGKSDGFDDGRNERVLLPYDDLKAFVRECTWREAPTEWKCLSLEDSTVPRLVFHGRKNLRQCVANKIIRRKLVRYLRDNFSDPDPGVTEVHFYDRVIPYSFTYLETCDLPVRTVGSLTLFHQEDLNKAYYDHTCRKEELNPVRPESAGGHATYWKERRNYSNLQKS